MKQIINRMELRFPSGSVNESFARGAVWLAVTWALTIAATAALHRALAQSPASEDEDDA